MSPRNGTHAIKTAMMPSTRAATPMGFVRWPWGRATWMICWKGVPGTAWTSVIRSGLMVGGSRSA